jgi:membrane protein YdbS with pleckstrin-like domain
LSDDRRFRRRRSGEAAGSPEAGSSVYHPPSADIPDQASPQWGSVIETRAFWRRQERRRRSARARPAPSTDEPATISSSPFRERASAARAHFLPLPEETVYRHLGRGEQVLHQDSPALSWFIFSNALWFVGLAALVALFIISLMEGWEWGALACLVGALVLVVILGFMRMAERYTSYVITNARMMRMSGVFNLGVESIPWVRVTDIRFSQGFIERAISTCTLNIDSANENAGLRRMSGIADPETFNRHLTDMVVAKQGATTPLGRESDYMVMPPDRSWAGFRKKKRARREVSVLVVEEPSPPPPPGGDVAGEEAASARSAGRGRPTTVDPDPALPDDLSNMEQVSATQMEADRKRQDTMLGRDQPPE